MKAQLELKGTQSIITLLPDTEAERELVREFSLKLNRTHIINSRGFEYMTPEVGFLIQEMPRSD